MGDAADRATGSAAFFARRQAAAHRPTGVNRAPFWSGLPAPRTITAHPGPVHGKPKIP